MAEVSDRPARLQWSITRGDDISLTLTFTDAQGTAIDLSARTYAAEVLSSVGTDVQAVTVGTDDAATGVLVLSLSDTETAGLTGALYLWKLVETNGSDTSTLLDGPFVVGTPGQAGITSGSSSATVTISQAAGVTVTCTAGGGGGGAVDSVNGQTGTVVLTASDVGADATGTAAGLVDDLSGVTDASTARTNLGLGSLATKSAVASADITDGTIVNADINAAAAIALSKLATDPLARANHTGTQAESTVTNLVSDLAAKAPLASPALTGTPTVPTAAQGTNTTQAASTAYVQGEGYLPKLAGGASVENVGAIESNVNTVAATGSTETLDTSLYAVHDCTMDQACTFTFSNPAPSGKNTTFMLILRGAFTPTLPASVKWSGGSAPSYTTPSVYTFTTIDAGTNWLGAQVGKAYA